MPTYTDTIAIPGPGSLAGALADVRFRLVSPADGSVVVSPFAPQVELPGPIFTWRGTADTAWDGLVVQLLHLGTPVAGFGAVFSAAQGAGGVAQVEIRSTEAHIS